MKEQISEIQVNDWSNEPNRTRIETLRNGTPVEVRYRYAGHPSFFYSKVAEDLAKLNETTDTQIVEWGKQPTVPDWRDYDSQGNRRTVAQQFRDLERSLKIRIFSNPRETIC